MHFIVQVLGHKPTANLCFLLTQVLAKNLLEYMKAPINIVGDIIIIIHKASDNLGKRNNVLL